jgi:hypothetical protein
MENYNRDPEREPIITKTSPKEALGVILNAELKKRSLRDAMDYIAALVIHSFVRERYPQKIAFNSHFSRVMPGLLDAATTANYKITELNSHETVVNLLKDALEELLPNYGHLFLGRINMNRLELFRLVRDRRTTGADITVAPNPKTVEWIHDLGIKLQLPSDEDDDASTWNPALDLDDDDDISESWKESDYLEKNEKALEALGRSFYAELRQYLLELISKAADSVVPVVAESSNPIINDQYDGSASNAYDDVFFNGVDAKLFVQPHRVVPDILERLGILPNARGQVLSDTRDGISAIVSSSTKLFGMKAPVACSVVELLRRNKIRAPQKTVRNLAGVYEVVLFEKTIQVA